MTKCLSLTDVLNDILKLFLLISVIKYKLIQLLQYLYNVLHTMYEPFFTAINITTPQEI